MNNSNGGSGIGLTSRVDIKPIKETVNIFDVKGSEPVKEQQASMKSHFATFMDSSKGRPGVKLDDIPFEEINDDLVGTFATYLACHAKRKNGKKGQPSQLLSHQSSVNYFSAFKNYLISRHHAKGDIAVLSKDRTSIIYRKMWRCKLDQCAQKGDVSKIFTEKKNLIGDEFGPLSALALWSGDKTMAELYHFAICMEKNLGRGSEIAILRKDHASTQTIVEPDDTKYDTLSLRIFRMKTASMANRSVDEVTNFLHVDDFKKCPLFAMLYHLVMDDSITNLTSEYMFPSWYNSVIQTTANTKSSIGQKRNFNSMADDNADGLPENEVIDSESFNAATFLDKKAKSAVAKVFERQWKRVFQQAAEYMESIKDSTTDTEVRSNSNHLTFAEKVFEFGIDQIRENLSVHDGKRVGVTKLGNMNLAPQHISCRAGWVMKSFHSFFDYWQGTVASMIITGKRVSGWNTGNRGCDSYTSGCPPTMEDTGASKQQIDCFINHLLGHQKHVSKEVKQVITAVGILRWDDLLTFLYSEPSGMYQSLTDLRKKHHFVREVSDVFHAFF